MYEADLLIKNPQNKTKPTNQFSKQNKTKQNKTKQNIIKNIQNLKFQSST
jgi:hypothetical protein